MGIFKPRIGTSGEIKPDADDDNQFLEAIKIDIEKNPQQGADGKQ
ncbi:hypothetical protein SDC9_174256 [bioreactor metagenome]|uniref:Uncharacterized protein n=1 Tax=bioreactor metagenome TaxID=1076179 RepID=A0A645GIN4_9ZZZZ